MYQNFYYILISFWYFSYSLLYYFMNGKEVWPISLKKKFAWSTTPRETCLGPLSYTYINTLAVDWYKRSIIYFRINRKRISKPFGKDVIQFLSSSAQILVSELIYLYIIWTLYKTGLYKRLCKHWYLHRKFVRMNWKL